MIKLEKFNLITLEKHMEFIATAFFASKRKQCKRVALLDPIGEERISEREAYVEKVEQAYAMLTPLEQIFINNDFFYEDYPLWWTKLYTKNKYLRYKKKAIIHFLRCFYEEG